MRKIFWTIILTLLFSTCYAAKPVYVLNVTGAIGPAVQDYISRGLATAKDQRAALVVIELDTPGGLEKSMHKIIQDILASPTPVVAYVAPAGARAASAGTFILYASHIAAMAPGTNIGAASPVNLAELAPSTDNTKTKTPLSKMQQKIMNDAVANIRSLAELRHRNANWAEDAVRNAVSLTAEEALKENVINVIASDVPNLLQKLNNYTIEQNRVPLILNTKDTTIVTIKPNWRYQVLSVLTDPNIAYLLLLIGIYGIFFEFLNPGMILPGLAGAICLLLAFYAFQLLPISFVGLTLLLIGIACMIAEISIASFGVAGICGIIAFIAGSFLLLDTDAPGYKIAWSVILLMSLASAALCFLILTFAVKSFYKPVVAGREALVGKIGEVLEFHADHVMVRVQGEIWSAYSTNHLKIGQKVRVTKIVNLILTVEPMFSLEE